MCGIAGIVNLADEKPPLLDEIVPMMSLLRYRGPDQSGVYLDERVALGHLRLSIIGIDSGIQPICNESGKLWIVYNGEIFNYIELKRELLGKGHRFATETDTEVLLHLYEEYGTRCLERINGQFACAIWDCEKRELFLARDRVGIRPLYYVWSGGRLIFASEIKSILAAGARRELDLQALSQVLIFWTTLPERTLFQGVRELPPGHFLLIKGAPAEPRRYWQLPVPTTAPAAWSAQEAAEELRGVLVDAVRLRLRADVPVGAYLSGGLDSSIIASLISRNCESHLKTFSMGFAHPSFDESSYQKELIGFLQADNRQVLIANGEIRGLLPDTIWHCEKPVLRSSPVPMLILSRLVREEGYKVVLSGEGADEILGGYNIFKEAKIRQYWGRAPESTRRPRLLERLYPYIFNNPSRGRLFLQDFFSLSKGRPEDDFFSHAVRWEGGSRNLSFLSEESLGELRGYDPMAELASWLPEGFSGRDLLSKAQFLEMEIFLANFLLSSQGDRVGMANSVEMRHPFLDHRVIELACRIPSKWKIRGLNEKYLLKKAFAGELPERILKRAKQPYRAPIRELFFQDAPRDFVDDLLSEERLQETGYFNPSKLSRLYARFRDGGATFDSEFQNMALMGALSTQLLHQQFVAGKPRAATQLKPDRVINGSAIPLPNAPSPR